MFQLEGFHTVGYNHKKGLFRKIDFVYLYRLQNHMVTLGEDVDGPRGSWLVVSMLWRLDLTITNLASAYATLESLVKRF
jgi:hypothetical protein